MKNLLAQRGKTGRRWLTPLILLITLAALSLQGPMPPVHAQEGTGTLALMEVSPTEIVWQPQVAVEALVLTIAGPGDLTIRQTFPSGTPPTFKPVSPYRQPYPDGSYRYELRAMPLVDAETQALMAEAREAGEEEARVAKLRESGKLPQEIPSQAGSFAMQDGAFILPGTAEAASSAATTPVKTEDDGLVRALDDLHNDDVITTGSLCVGFDCVNGESFGYTVIKLKENNLQLGFEDTSIGTFPTNDWKIQTNDTTSGGANYFTVWDVDGGKRIFTLEAGAPAHSLYVEEYGRVGLGTSIPYVELHIVDGDSPTIRLDQDGSFGWAAQVWDIVGNETNFSIRDVNNGSKLPFRIQPNAPSNSLTLKANGNAGFGTWSPAYPVELETTGKDAVLAAERTDGATAKLAALGNSVQVGSISNHEVDFVVADQAVMTLDASGNLTLDGALIESSDVNVKENFAPIDGQQILACLAEMPITTWNYRNDDESVRHMGPMAQDFYAAFGLGADERHIAPLDANGVAFVAIQELHRATQAQDTRIAQLEQQNLDLQQQNATLESRVAALEALVETLLQAE